MSRDRSSMQTRYAVHPGMARTCALACVGLLVLALAGAQETRPNVLFMIADDLRVEPDPTQVFTPSLDRLAREGLMFSRAFCQIAVCGPSRVSLLSGVRPDTLGVYTNPVTLRKSKRPDIVTLPQHFRENGYHTVSVGKVFHHEEVETGGDVRMRPGDDPHSWSEPPWHHGTPYQQWFKADSLAAMKKRADPPAQKKGRGPAYEAANQPDEVYPDAQIATRAIETLRRVKDQRFFLAVGFRRPHLPFNAPQKYWDLYPPEKIKLPNHREPPKNAPEIALHDCYELRSYAGMPATGAVSDAEAIALIRGYRATVSQLDAQVGRVLNELDRLGLARNTIVVFTSDHGYHLGENSLWTKMTNFELGTQVPLVFRLPGDESRGRQSLALVELVDLYPTLAELCGLTLPTHLEGRSMAPLFANPEAAGKKAVFSQFPRRVPGGTTMGHSVRTERFRYTEWQDAGRSTELYDLSRDPLNGVNVAGDPEYQQQQKELAAILNSARKPRP